MGTGTTTTTTAVTYLSAAWNFDNGTDEVYGVYSGQFINGAALSPNSTVHPYIGQGHALSCNGTMNQSFQVASPFLNLSSTSFTIEAWIFAFSFSGDVGIFGQCQCSSCANQCLFFLVRGSRLYAGFTLNDLSGTQSLTASVWYHVAFVYDVALQEQILYVNGIQESNKTSAAAYQGSSGAILIGSTISFPNTNFFTGYIDNVRLVTRAKSATEILSDASLVAHYSFDLPSPTQDSGPNGLNGTSINTASVSGRVNQAMRFTGSTSYFQAFGFYQLGFGVNYNRAFSISMWINPASFGSCTFVQQSTLAAGGSCFNMLGIWTYTGNSGQIVAQGYAWPTVYGPSITLNTWMHLSWTFSLANGYILYANGVRYGTTGYYSYGGTSGLITWLQIGYNFGCSSAYITNAAFQGSIDEIYAHNRELSATEVAALANP